MRNAQPHNQAGITLIELVVAIAIIALLATFATQGATRAIYASRTAGGLASLIASLTRARSVAASTEIDVVLCPSVDGETCSAGYHWERGWIAFQATKPGSNHVADEAIVVRESALASNVHLITSPGRTRIRFQGNGSNAGSNATFTLCDGRGPRSATAYAMANNGNLHATAADPGNVALACAGL
jgi:type IV fimbrial biogenesis protein FimT